MASDKAASDKATARTRLAAPGPAGLTRRHVLFGLAALLAEAGFWAHPLLGNGQTVAPAGSKPAPASAFLAFSQAITGHQDLSAVTAARIETALRQHFPGFAAQFALCGALAVTPVAPKALLQAATAAGARELALAVVAAWYTGTVGKGAQAVVVAYAEALMFRPVSDAQVVPTYCNYGPQWWTRAPPPVGVAVPVEPKPVPAPATTGTPEPKGQQAR